MTGHKAPLQGNDKSATAGVRMIQHVPFRIVSILWAGALTAATALAQEELKLDPQVQALLEKMKERGAFSGLATPADVERARKAYLAFSQYSGQAEPVLSVKDRRIPGPGGAIPIRIYKPREGAGLPVVVYFHGGIFITGSLDTHDVVLRRLANRSGAIIVSVGYRLAPEHPYPAAPEDSYAATRWVAAHAGEIGGDGTRLAVAGDGAGGNLAAVVTEMARDRGGPALRFQVLICPITSRFLGTGSRWEFRNGPTLNRDGLWHHLALYIPVATDLRDPYISPLAATTFRGLPPALIITAEFDLTRDEAEQYAHQLLDGGVHVTVSRYQGMVHGFFHMAVVLDAGKRCIDEIARALQDQMGAQ